MEPCKIDYQGHIGNLQPDAMAQQTIFSIQHSARQGIEIGIQFFTSSQN